MDEITLAYAVSVHKSQGSEYPCVILPLTTSHYMMLHSKGIWKRLEQLVRSWAVEYEQIYIVTGPVLKGSFKSIGPNQVSVPEY